MKFAFGIFAIIISAALFRLFDFKNMRFEKTGLTIVYMVGLAISIYAVIKSFKNRTE